MKKILGIGCYNFNLTAATTNIVACSTQHLMELMIQQRTEYEAVYMSDADIGSHYRILWEDHCLFIFNNLYEKFKNKLESYIKNTDSAFNIGKGTISKIKFSYKTDNYNFPNSPEIKVWDLVDLYDIQGTRTN